MGNPKENHCSSEIKGNFQVQEWTLPLCKWNEMESRGVWGGS